MPETSKPPRYDWAKHWQREITASKKWTEDWRNRQAPDVLARYQDERQATLSELDKQAARWNYFWAMKQTRLAMLYGQTPVTNVDRRYADADDDPARVAGEMLERILNSDLQGANDGMLAALRHVLFDADVVDCGQARIHYEMDESRPAKDRQEAGGEVEGDGERAPPTADPESYSEVTDERACVRWVHWKDFYWSAGAKVWSDVRWVAFGCDMPRDELVRRFGKVGKSVPLTGNKSEKAPDGKEDVDPRKRAYVYEVWSKEHGKCFWYVEGMVVLLDGPVDPPLRLKGFWCCPEPIIQNCTTSALLPRPDYLLCQDLYIELDSLATRTKLLEEALKVRGVYNGASEGVKRLLQQGGGNELIAVDNWALHGEKGGLKGQVDWMPLEMVANTLIALQQRAEVVKAALQEINGHSDVLRGEAMGAGVTATDARRATRMSSVRLQQAQDRFARFASDLMRLKAEVVCDMFDEERIIERSNVLRTADGRNPELVRAAVELLKSGVSDYRIEIRPESVSLEDFSAQKSEAVEVLDAMGKFLQVGSGVVQAIGPSATPFLLKLMQGALAKVRGARWVEGILDPAIAQAEKAAEAAAANPQAQQPNPEALKAQNIRLKGEMDMQKEQAKLQADVVKARIDVEAQQAIQAAQTEQNLLEERGKAMIKGEADVRRAALEAQKPAPERPGAAR